MGASPVFISNVKNAGAQILNATGTSLVTLLTPNSSGSRLRSLVCTSDDSSDRVIQLWVTMSGTDYLLGEITIPDGSGSNGTDKAVNVLDPLYFPFLQTDGAGNYIDLASGAVLKVKSKTAVTAGLKLHFFGEYGDF